MNGKKALLVSFLLVSIGLVLGLALSSNLNIQLKGHTEESPSGRPEISDKAVEILTSTGEAMAEVAEAVKPSVVNISTTRTIRQRIPDVFSDPFFRRFFGDEFGLREPMERKATSLGSGVIVDKDGYILTNNHVIKGADEIKVTLSDKREFTGKVIGTDPKSDLAVIKIESNHLPVIQWGDSNRLRVGETVIAIGSPYGLTLTVTSGIVSAVGRANVGIADYEDFIQTDAAINPGNSGGALVNARGELVGINTAIFSTTGGYQGIGFAIPTNMAKTVLKSLVEEGKVTRGWLGVYIQPLTPEIAEQFGLEGRNGALISDVVEGGPAEKAGIERGDLIFEYQGRKVEDPTSLRNMVAETLPGSEVSVRLIRNKKETTLSLKIAEIPEEERAAAAKQYENALKGVYVEDITPDIRSALGIPARVKGVMVASVEDSSPSSGALMKDDVISEINRKKIKNTKEYSEIASKLSPKERVLLLIYRDGSVFYRAIIP